MSMRSVVTPVALQQIRDIFPSARLIPAPEAQGKVPHVKDHSYHTPACPELIVKPLNTLEVSKLMRVCFAHRLTVTAAGGMTGLEGGCIPTNGGVTLDLSLMNKVLHHDVEGMNVRVQAGVRKESLNKYLKPQGQFFPVDPASNPTLGGMTACGSSGTWTVKYGTMKENLLCLTVVLADGHIIETRRVVRKSSTGYDLTQLFSGQEGTLGIVTEITVRTRTIPPAVCTCLVAFDNIDATCRAVTAMVQAQIDLARCEVINQVAVKSVNTKFKTQFPVLPLLLLEFNGPSEDRVFAEANAAKAIVARFSKHDFAYAADEKERDRLWTARRGAYFAGLISRGPPDRQKGRISLLITDVCVPLSKLAQCVSETEEDMRKSRSGFVANIVGHVADGNFHAMIPFYKSDPAEVAELNEINERLWQRALKMGGTVSGEHGVGQGKVAAAAQEHGEDVLRVYRSIKAALDPHNMLNPDKMFAGGGPTIASAASHHNTLNSKL